MRAGPAFFGYEVASTRRARNALAPLVMLTAMPRASSTDSVPLLQSAGSTRATLTVPVLGGPLANHRGPRYGGADAARSRDRGARGGRPRTATAPPKPPHHSLLRRVGGDLAVCEWLAHFGHHGPDEIEFGLGSSFLSVGVQR